MMMMIYGERMRREEGSSGRGLAFRGTVRLMMMDGVMKDGLKMVILMVYRAAVVVFVAWVC